MKKKIIMGLFVLATVIGMGFAFDEYKQGDLLIALEPMKCYDAKDAIRTETKGKSVIFFNSSQSKTICVQYKIKYSVMNKILTKSDTVYISPIGTKEIAVSGPVNKVEIVAASYCD